MLSCCRKRTGISLSRQVVMASEAAPRQRGGLFGSRPETPARKPGFRPLCRLIQSGRRKTSGAVCPTASRLSAAAAFLHGLLPRPFPRRLIMRREILPAALLRLGGGRRPSLLLQAVPAEKPPVPQGARSPAALPIFVPARRRASRGRFPAPPPPFHRTAERLLSLPFRPFDTLFLLQSACPHPPFRLFRGLSAYFS